MTEPIKAGDRILASGHFYKEFPDKTPGVYLGRCPVDNTLHMVKVDADRLADRLFVSIRRS